MRRPILVLQYPDSREARTVAIAATRNPKALVAFKQVVLEEARLRVLDREADDVLNIQEKLELERLTQILNLLIPNEDAIVGCQKTKCKKTMTASVS